MRSGTPVRFVADKEERFAHRPIHEVIDSHLRYVTWDAKAAVLQRQGGRYPQIRWFLPLLIEAIELEATDSAQPVLAAYHALGNWLAERPRTAWLFPGRRAGRPMRSQALGALQRQYGVAVQAGRTACSTVQGCQLKRLADIVAMHGLKQQLRQPRHQRNEPGIQQRSRQERTGEQSADAASRSPLEDETGPQSHRPGVGVPGLEGIEDPLDVADDLLDGSLLSQRR
jgi:hypothetical protein